MISSRSEYELGDLAAHLNLSDEGLALVEKHSSRRICAIAEVAAATAEEICFVDTESYLPQLKKSQAGVVVLSESLAKQAPTGPAAEQLRLQVPDAKLAFARVGRNVRIGARAVIERETAIGDGTIVQPGAYIGRNVRIGNDCVIFANSVIYDYCHLGDRVRIHANTTVGCDGFGYAQEVQNERLTHVKIHHLGKVVIGDDVEIGASTSIDRGTISDTVIKRGSKIDNQVQIGHNCLIGESVIICGHTGLSGSVTVEDRAVLAGFVGVNNKALIGKDTIVGGFTGVSGELRGGVWKGQIARRKEEFYKIEATLAKLPEIYKLMRKLRKQFDAPSDTKTETAT